MRLCDHHEDSTGTSSIEGEAGGRDSPRAGSDQHVYSHQSVARPGASSVRTGGGGGGASARLASLPAQQGVPPAVSEQSHLCSLRAAETVGTCVKTSAGSISIVVSR